MQVHHRDWRGARKSVPTGYTSMHLSSAVIRCPRSFCDSPRNHVHCLFGYLGSDPGCLTETKQAPKQGTPNKNDRVLRFQSLAVCRCEVFGSSSLAVYLVKQGGEGAKGLASGRGDTFRLLQSSDQVCQRKGRGVPGSLGDSWKRRGAKHQALRANQMLHLCRCKRYAGREKVEAQAPYNIGILCQWRDPRWCDISQLAYQGGPTPRHQNHVVFP